MEIVMELERKDINFTWSVYDLERTDDEEKRVIAVHWKCVGEYLNYKSERTGVTKEFQEQFCQDIYDVMDGKEFIPYEDLTQEICITWVKYAPGFNPLKVELGILNSIVEQIKPPVLNGVPWEK
jgi:hypothetical protein